MALLGRRSRWIRQCLQLEHRGSPIGAPQVHAIAIAGIAAWPGEHIGLHRCLLLGQLKLQGDLVAAEPGSLLVEVGGFGSSRVQLAAEPDIPSLHQLKETNVLESFDMEFFPYPPGIGGRLSHQRGSGGPNFAPGEATGQDTPANRDDQSGSAYPDLTEPSDDGDDGRSEQREPRIAA